MLAGIVAGSGKKLPVGVFDAVRFDNRTTQNSLIKTASTADNAFFTASLWFKTESSIEDGNQHSLFQMSDFNTYFFINEFSLRDITCAFVGPSGKYFQFGTAGSAYSDDAWNHIFLSADTNHAAGSKLKTLYVNGANADYAANTADSDSAFNILFNSKHFGVPLASGNGPDAGSRIAFAHVWLAPGVHLTASDVTKFRSVGGSPVDLGSNGQTPTGTSPAYYFKGNNTTFAANLGTGGAVTLTGSMENVFGPT